MGGETLLLVQNNMYALPVAVYVVLLSAIGHLVMLLDGERGIRMILECLVAGVAFGIVALLVGILNHDALFTLCIRVLACYICFSAVASMVSICQVFNHPDEWERDG